MSRSEDTRDSSGDALHRIWILGAGHSASLRTEGTAGVRWRAPWFLCGMRASSPAQHDRDGRAPFFCTAKSNFKVTMILFRELGHLRLRGNEKAVGCTLLPTA